MTCVDGIAQRGVSARLKATAIPRQSRAKRLIVAPRDIDDDWRHAEETSVNSCRRTAPTWKSAMTATMMTTTAMTTTMEDGHSKDGLTLPTRQKIEVCPSLGPVWCRRAHKGGELSHCTQADCTFCHCSLFGPDGTCTLTAT
ncbi:uncharacterized protein [Oscarella lobularis]|uniref:uncharacterized protein n=1 Tax=Oscarella lobularis TaxID=121494 RepID=UPI0033142430